MIEIKVEADHFIIIIKNRKVALDIELLFTARNIPFLLKAQNRVWKYKIPIKHKSFTMKEISLYQDENRPIKNAFPYKDFSFSPINFFVILCFILFHFYVKSAGVYPEFIQKGMLSANEALSGEWVRVFTSLTLHGSNLHLFSNMLLLWIFSCAISQYWGVGQAWLYILLSGGMGNLMNALLYHSNHNSIGASTAVFGALGIMSGIGARLGTVRNQSFKYRVAPLFAAICLLALLGSDPNTDIMAHAFGLISGALIGLAGKDLSKRNIVENQWVQITSFFCFSVIIITAWISQL